MILGSFEFCLALWNQWQLRFLDLLSFYLQHGTSRFSTMINKSWNTFWRNYCWYRTMCFQELLWSFACKTQLSCTSSSSIILPDEQTWNQMWSEVWSHSATEIRRGKHEIRCVSVTSAAGAYLYPKSPPAKILYERDTVFVVFPLWLPCIRGYLMHIDAKRFGDSYKVSSCFNHSTSLALLQQLEQLHWVDVANCGCAGWKIHPFSGSKVKDGELGSLKFATLYCKGFWTGLSSATTKMPELLEAWTSFLQTLLKWQKNPFAAVAGSALGDQHAKCITCLLVYDVVGPGQWWPSRRFQFVVGGWENPVLAVSSHG